MEHLLYRLMFLNEHWTSTELNQIWITEQMYTDNGFSIDVMPIIIIMNYSRREVIKGESPSAETH